MDLADARHWQSNEAIDDFKIAERITDTFSYHTHGYLGAIGINVAHYDWQMTLQCQHIDIQINFHCWHYTFRIYGWREFSIRIKQSREELLRRFEQIRTDYEAVIRSIVAALPQPIAEEVAPQVSFWWKVELAIRSPTN